MSLLFSLQDGQMLPKEEILLLHPFNELWKRDKTKDKKRAIEELSYIELVCSELKSNPLKKFPTQTKETIAKTNLSFKKDWKPDKLVLSAIDKIMEIQQEHSITLGYYLSAKKAVEKMKDFFENVDLTAVNPKTFSPLYKPKDLTSALNDTEKVISNLKALEKRVEEEIDDVSRNRANKSISPFADPEWKRK